jgi:hypothetical protein
MTRSNARLTSYDVINAYACGEGFPVYSMYNELTQHSQLVKTFLNQMEEQICGP